MADLDPREHHVKTRLARPSDLPVLVRMVGELAACHGDQATVSEDVLREDIFAEKPWIYVLIAEIEDQIVGYSVICPLIQLHFGSRGADMLKWSHLFGQFCSFAKVYRV